MTHFADFAISPYFSSTFQWSPLPKSKHLIKEDFVTTIFDPLVWKILNYELTSVCNLICLLICICSQAESVTQFVFVYFYLYVHNLSIPIYTSFPHYSFNPSSLTTISNFHTLFIFFSFTKIL